MGLGVEATWPGLRNRKPLDIVQTVFLPFLQILNPPKLTQAIPYPTQLIGRDHAYKKHVVFVRFLLDGRARILDCRH